MTDERLLDIQRNLSYQFGGKVDVYHSEEHRGILAVPGGAPFTPENVIYRGQY